MENKNDKYTKPGYDARQVYYDKVIIPHVEAMSLAIIQLDFENWLKFLQNIYTFVMGYISPKDSSRISKSLSDLRNSLFERGRLENKNNQLYLRQLEENFRSVTNDLVVSAKHMLLPIKDDGDDEYDTEEFFRGSDL